MVGVGEEAAVFTHQLPPSFCVLCSREEGPHHLWPTPEAREQPRQTHTEPLVGVSLQMTSGDRGLPRTFLFLLTYKDAVSKLNRKT